MSSIDMETESKLRANLLDAAKSADSGEELRGQYNFEAGTIKLAKDYGAYWIWAGEMLLEIPADDSQVRTISALLDLSLRRVSDGADTTGAGPAEEYFALQETALSILPLTLSIELLGFLETHYRDLGKLATGESSIILLRTCRALLNSLDVRAHSIEAGRVLQLLALIKGFPHPSRLNKKGLKSAWMRSEPSEQDLIDFTPTYVMKRLNDPATLASSSDFPDFLLRLRDILKGLKTSTKSFMRQRHGNATAEAYTESNRSGLGLQDWSELSWDKPTVISSLAVAYLIKIVRPSMSADDAESKSILVEIDRLAQQILQSVRSAGHALDGFLETDQRWSAWKQNGYGSMDLPPAELPTVSPEEAYAAMPRLPEFEPKIGNDELTELWKVQIVSDKFVDRIDWPAETKQLEAKANAANSKPERDSYEFLALNTMPLTDLINNFASQPIATHDLSELEAKVAAPPPVPAPAKRSAEPEESMAKRPRVSYEDATPRASVDRHQAMQNTLKPLPY